MSLAWTLAVLGVAIAVLVVTLILARRPYLPGKPPLVPLTAIQFIALVVIFVMAGHLVSLVTGQPFEPRGRLMP